MRWPRCVRLGLANTRDEALRNPLALSGGQRQRLAIACALALGPAVLILDEPTANLDPVASAEFYTTLAGLRDGTRTMILVEHELDDALPLAGRVIVLDSIDLELRAGEFLAIAGVNGAGKSTLTRALAGLVPLSAGSVELEGAPLVLLDARQIGDRIGYVFQNPEHQFITRTVADELAYGLRARRRDQTEIDTAVQAMLERFDLARYAETDPFLLSHGEKRRLSAATALITEPRILILDEPTFGQDRARADEIIAMVDELNASGITIVVVTQDLQLVTEHAHRVAILAGGRLLDPGTATEFLSDKELILGAGLRQPGVGGVTRAGGDFRLPFDSIGSSHVEGEVL